jgi:20S proteasome alpha/beta subunit
MTTIAYKDGVLASDGKITAGGCVTNLTSKKIFRVNSAWIGVCGTVADWGLVVDYLNNNGTPIPPTAEFDCIYMPDKGKAVILEVCKGGILREIAFAPPFAIGSGGNFAIGAMAHGASAIEAVKIACKYDVYSGGKVQSVKRGQKK